MAGGLKMWAVDRLGDVIRMGGGIIENPDHIAARRAVCDGCPHAGMVEPLPLLKVKGCTLCGCPFRTKCKTLRHFHAKTGKVTDTTCPLGKWERIDEYFKDMSLVKSIADFGKVKANPLQAAGNAFAFPVCACPGKPACEDRVEIPEGAEVASFSFGGEVFTVVDGDLLGALQKAVEKYEFDTFMRIEGRTIRHIGKLALESITVLRGGATVSDKPTEGGAPVRHPEGMARETIPAERLCALTKACASKFTITKTDGRGFTHGAPDGTETSGTVEDIEAILALEGVTAASVEDVASEGGDYQILTVEILDGYSFSMTEVAAKHCGCKEVFV